MSESFSPALTNVLQGLDPGKRPKGEGCYPMQCRGLNLRINNDELPASWFKRIIDGTLLKDQQACTIERNLAVFLKFGWENSRFTYLNCQALATIEGLETLQDVYERPRYLRLDYDENPLMLGQLFSHPVVHIHGQPGEAPRYAIESSGGLGTPLIDFFDFLYRNFCHSEWCKWADVVWRREAGLGDLASHFEVIREYFKEEDTPGKKSRLPEIIQLCRQRFPAMKKAFRAAKETMPLALPIDPDFMELFNYHQG